MEIRLYDDIQKMPGNGWHSVLSSNLLIKEHLDQEKGPELKACLGALMAIDFPLLIVHVFIQRDSTILGGEDLRIVITSKPQPQPHFVKSLDVWGLSNDHNPEGSCGRVIRIPVDVAIETHLAEQYRDEYREKKKDLAGWMEYFKKELESIRQNALERSLKTLRLIECLTPPHK